jgi:transcriptional regulator with XRE-family HTH domain
MKLHRQRKEIVMPINENIANFIKRYKEERQLSVAELSEELGIAKSAAANYLNGDCNPRADTIELLAKKCGVSATEIISARPPEWKRAARLFSDLPPERRDRAVHLFLSLIDILSENRA